MIIKESKSSLGIVIGSTEYVAIRIARIATLADDCKSRTVKPNCNVFQDGNGNLIVEYDGKRVIDERENPIGVVVE